MIFNHLVIIPSLGFETYSIAFDFLIPKNKFTMTFRARELNDSIEFFESHNIFDLHEFSLELISPEIISL